MVLSHGTICIRPGVGNYPSSPGHYNHPSCITDKQINIINDIRMLWEQHVYWTRFFIISEALNLPDLDLVTQRLLQNPVDFEMLLKSFYGANSSAKFRSLFNDHLVIAAQLVKAAKAGDTNAAADAEKKWYANADDIAEFLGNINPYWSKESWRKMMHEHLAMTKDEAVDILTKNYDAGIKKFDEIEKGAMLMADTMAKGIIRQFPS